ncbi:MAG: bifunctional chorismate mutase/prephenate dehydrogenase [Steroidobacteraceae bacterium]
MDLRDLRRQLDEIDQQMLELFAARQRASEEIARAKRRDGRATRDFSREREVVMAARARAESLGVPGESAEALMRLMIRASLTTQEHAALAADGAGSGQRALVIGGAGNMGRWFVGFLQSLGFAVSVSDPAGTPEGSVQVDWRKETVDHEVIIVAAPMVVSSKVLLELAVRRPPGLICDIGSLKSPLRAGLMALKSHGCKVTSIHPMFGPGAQLLSGRHVIFIDLGCEEALAQARALFAPTMVEQVVMTLEEHDRLIAYVLGLSHALNIAFCNALAASGEAAPKLSRLSSTTFDAQFDVAARVTEDNPEMYYEIQSLNDYGAEPLEALARAVERLRTAVLTRDHDTFVSMMLQGREYMENRRDLAARRA